MKFAFITLTALLNIASANAEGLICKQINVTAEFQPRILRVQVQKLQTLPTKYKGKTYDSVSAVNVKVMELRGSNLNLLKNFNAVATAEDVVYEIDASENGVKFGTFFDEFNQSWLKLLENGKVNNYRLNCQPIGAE